MAGQQVIISVLADTAKFNKAMSGTERALGKLGNSTKKMAQVATVAFAAAAAAAGAFAAKAISLAEEAAKVNRQIENQVKNIKGLTGSVAGVTKRIDDFAYSLGAAAGVDDEFIKSAGALLLPMTNIGKSAGKVGGVFEKTLASALDISTLSGRDLTAVTKELGKAINDPFNAAKKLAKVGIVLTDSQKKQLDVFKQNNDVLGAQNFLLGLVEEKYGGAAEAGATASGKFKFAIDNLFESIGGALLPAVTNLADTISAWLAEKKDDPKFKKFLKDLGKAANDFGSFLTDVVLPGLVGFSDWVIQNGDLLKNLAIIVGVLYGAFVLFNIIMGIADFIMGVYAVTTTIAAVAEGALLAPLWLIVAAVVAVIAIIALVIIYWNDIISTLQKVGDFIWKFIKDTWDGFIKWGSDLINWFTDLGGKILGGLLKGLSDAGGAIGAFFASLGNTIVDAWNNFWGIKSPSRRMMKLGKLINQGLAIGLSDTSQIDRAVKGINSSMTGNLQVPSGSLVSPVGGNNYTITVQAVAPNAEVGKAVVDSISEYERFNGGRGVSFAY